MNTRFNTTGHTLEFLSIGLPDARLNEPWVRNAANILSKELIDNRRAQANPGPLYHSVNALRNYRDRVRKTMPKAEEIAKAPTADPAAPTPTPTPETAPPQTAPAITPTPSAAPPAPQVATPSAPSPAPTLSPPGIASIKPTLPVPRPTTATPPTVITSRSTPPAPLVIPPGEALPAPLPETIPVPPPLSPDASAKAVLPSLVDPARIQPGLLAAEAPVSALAPQNR
jgi:hypothetical protein